MDHPAPTAFDAQPDDQTGRLFRRNRRLATGLLLAAAALFVGLKFVPEAGFWTQMLRAMAEAAVVGGLADWFAVTALFRRPLGLPIPHTAIVPRNKDRIGEGLGRFVERNFLDPALVADRLRTARPADRLVAWLGAPGTAEAIADRLVAVLPSLLHGIEDRELRAFFGKAVGDRLGGVEISPLLGRLLALLLESGQHQPLVERMVAAALDFVERNEGRLENAISEKSSWWVPRSIDRRVARSVSLGVRELLVDLLDPASLARIRLEMAVEELARDLQYDPDTRAKVEAVKQGVLAQPEVQAWMAGLWDRLRDAALSDLGAEDGRTRTVVAAVLRSAATTLARDATMRQRIDRSAERLAMRVVVPWRGAIGRFIADVVRSWDARTVTDRLEQAVGSDLQYVRISGTLVAATVGGVLFLLNAALD